MSHQKSTLIKGKTYFMNKLCFFLFLFAFSIYGLFHVSSVHSSEWSAPLAISTHSAEDRNPAISKLFLDEIDEFELWIVWESNRDGDWNIYGSYYSFSSDTWSPPVQLTFHPSEDLAPVLVTNSLGTYLAWESNRDGNWNIYMKHFTNNKWSEPIQVTNNDADDKNPAVSGLPGYLSLAWQSNRNGNWDIFINWLNISEWDSVRQVTSTLSDETSPTVADGGYQKILIAFESDRDSSWNIYSREYNYVDNIWGEILTVSKSNSNNRNAVLSDDFGDDSIICWQHEDSSNSTIITSTYSWNGWGESATLTNDSSQNVTPQTTSTRQPLSVCCEPPIIVWCSDRDGNWNIYSKDGAVTTDDSTDCSPAITSFISYDSYGHYKLKYWLTWQSNRDGDYNIYVATKEKLLSAVEDNDYSPDKKNYYLSQNYPNPFNNSTLIQYYIPKNSFVNLSIYNIEGCKINTLVNGFQAKGFLEAKWDGIDKLGNLVSSGIYIYSLTIGNEILTKKLIMIG